MAIGKLNLTTYLKPNVSLMREMGCLKRDNLKNEFYKYFCKLEFAEVFWEPHKFGPITNWGISYTKINIYPKYFNRFESLKDYLFDIFPNHIDIDLNQFKVSRIEVHSDIENFSLDVVLARLWVMGYRRESVSFYKGNTIYIGTNPKIRIFNKTQQLMHKVSKGKLLTEAEKNIFQSEKPITRFSIEIRNFNGNLQDIANDPKSLVSYFDRFKFYNFEDDELIPKLGGLQILFSKVRREHRKSFEKFKDKELEALIKRNFLFSVKQWFKEEGKGKGSFDLDKEIDRQINKLIKSIKS